MVHICPPHSHHTHSHHPPPSTGADSISGDRLGVFNLTVRGHARCVRFMADYGLPTLVVGGGGYTMCNVARCWAYETGVLLGM